MQRKISLESRDYLTETLSIKAHPLWGRIIWNELERSGDADEKKLRKIGITRATLWQDGENPVLDFTYGKWFSLIEYGYKHVGKDFPIRLAEVANDLPPPFTESIIHTCPDLRTFLQFMETRATHLEKMIRIVTKPSRGGATLRCSYQMSDKTRDAFALSCVGVLNYASRSITGNALRGVHLGFPDSAGHRASLEARLGIRVASWGEVEADIEVFCPDEILDRVSIGCDPIRYQAALGEFDVLCDSMRDVNPKTNLCDLVISLQVTSSKVYSMEQMASKLNMGVESYRKTLFKLGTSHKALVQHCVRYNAERMQKDGKTQQEICRELSLQPARLKRFLERGAANQN